MVDRNQSEADRELEAIRLVFSTLQPLDEGARGRVVEYVADRLGIVPRGTVQRPAPNERVKQPDAQNGPATGSAPAFKSLAELYEAARPSSHGDKALVVAYWLQTGGQKSFDSFSVNKELKNLGEGVANITAAFDTLRTQKPALVLQLRKSGNSRQARKTYKVTVAGIKAVQDMLGG